MHEFDSDLLPPDYNKVGPGLLVQEAVDRISDIDSAVREQELLRPKVDTAIKTRDPWQRRLDIAGRMQQFALAIGTRSILRHALPAMTDWLQHNDSLTVSAEAEAEATVRHDYRVHEVEDGYTPTPLLQEIWRARFWPLDANNTFQDKVLEPAHPYHGFSAFCKPIFKERADAIFAWQTEGPGKNSKIMLDPKDFEPAPVRRFGDIFQAHLGGLIIDEIAGVAIRNILHGRPSGTAKDVHDEVVEELHRIRWIATVPRKQAERRTKEENLPSLGFVVSGAADELARGLARGGSVISLLAPFLRRWSIQNPDAYCPLPSIQNDPWKRTALCAGDISFTIPKEERDDRPSKAQVAAFFETADVPLPKITRMGATTATLPIGLVQVRKHLWPPLVAFLNTHRPR